MIHRTIHAVCAATVAFTTIAYADEVVVLDQIGNGNSLAGSASSSQFAPGNPQGAFITIDAFTLDTPVRITSIEAVIAELQNVNSYNLVQSWHVGIYSSLEQSTVDFFGDVFHQSYKAPDSLSSGFDPLFGSELASFGTDFILQPGEYAIAVSMENDGDTNGTVGIRHSNIGEGGVFFGGPGSGDLFELGAAGGAYRIIGDDVIPSPSGLALFALAGLGRRRRSHAE